MFHNIKGLLQSAVVRAKMTRQKIAYDVIEIVNIYLEKKLPEGHKRDARAVYYKERVVQIDCLNSSALYFIGRNKNKIICDAESKIENIKIDRIKARLVSSFHDTI